MHFYETRLRLRVKLRWSAEVIYGTREKPPICSDATEESPRWTGGGSPSAARRPGLSATSVQPEGTGCGAIAFIEEISAPPSLIVLADLSRRPGQRGQCPQETSIGAM